MSALPITMGYAALLALLLLVLSMRVVDGRRRFGVNLGDGDNPAMQRRIRAHANFVEYVPLLLILLALLEAAALPSWLLHSFGATLLVARLLHGYALAFSEHWMAGRFVGTLLSFILLAVMALSGLCAALIGT